MAVILTNGGEEWVVDKLSEAVQTKAEYVGWGTGAGVAAKADADLFIPANEARVQGVTSKVGVGAAAKLQLVGAVTSQSAQTITNAGLFTTAGAGSPPAGGTLVVHISHGASTLDIGDAIEYTVTIDPS